jgi:hypothetical protein
MNYRLEGMSTESLGENVKRYWSQLDLVTHRLEGMLDIYAGENLARYRSPPPSSDDEHNPSVSPAEEPRRIYPALLRPFDRPGDNLELRQVLRRCSNKDIDFKAPISVVVELPQEVMVRIFYLLFFCCIAVD